MLFTRSMLDFLCCVSVAGERLVNVGGAECPCGGTHVKNTSEIASLTVTKIKKVLKSRLLSVIIDQLLFSVLEQSLCTSSF